MDPLREHHWNASPGDSLDLAWFHETVVSDDQIGTALEAGLALGWPHEYVPAAERHQRLDVFKYCLLLARSPIKVKKKVEPVKQFLLRAIGKTTPGAAGSQSAWARLVPGDFVVVFCNPAVAPVAGVDPV